MILHVYTLYDCKSLSYSPPFFAVSDGVATRMVQDLASELSNTVGRHPADYTLYRLGDFDDASGQLLPDDVRHYVTDVLPLVARRGQPDLFGGLADETRLSPNGSIAEVK